MCGACGRLGDKGQDCTWLINKTPTTNLEIKKGVQDWLYQWFDTVNNSAEEKKRKKQKLGGIVVSVH